jgi:hypothetical protein
MLIGNGTYLNLNAGRLRGGGAAPISQGNYQKVGAWRGVALPDGGTAALELIGYPTGYSGEGWFMPITGGELTSLYNTDFSFTPTGPILDGRALETSVGDPTTFGFTTEATGALIATVGAGDAPATFGLATNTPDLTASLGGDGTADFGIATGTSTLIADGLAVGTGTFGFTTDWVGYATGAMSGTTADSGVTIDGIVQALEAAVLPVDVVKVNSYTVQGDGQSGSEWGPV